MSGRRWGLKAETKTDVSGNGGPGFIIHTNKKETDNENDT